MEGRWILLPQDK